MRSRSLITIWPTIHFYSKLTISLLTILSETGPRPVRKLRMVAGRRPDLHSTERATGSSPCCCGWLELGPVTTCSWARGSLCVSSASLVLGVAILDFVDRLLPQPVEEDVLVLVIEVLIFFPFRELSTTLASSTAVGSSVMMGLSAMLLQAIEPKANAVMSNDGVMADGLEPRSVTRRFLQTENHKF